MLGRFRRLAFGLPPGEASFARRGFRGGDGAARERLERLGRTFIEGYHLALEDTDPIALGRRLNGIDAKACGFAFEGAAMALALPLRGVQERFDAR